MVYKNIKNFAWLKIKQIINKTLFIYYNIGMDEDFDDYENDSDASIEDKNLTRSQTAPPRPLTEMEEFRKSRIFYHLEQAVLSSSHLIQKQNQKYDLDSIEGQKNCSKFLKYIEKLQHRQKECAWKKIEKRNNFTNAYKILYKEGSLCYLTEILESAQEAYPFLWVNGKKYDFTKEVLDGAEKLFAIFTEIQHILRNVYIRVCNDNTQQLEPLRAEMVRFLEKFDDYWIAFESQYVSELMSIESDARKYISDAIETEKELFTLETREKMKGKVILDNPKIPLLKEKLCLQICSNNSVANCEGKGRDDLHYEILAESDEILKKISMNQSKSVRLLAEAIRKSFISIRSLLRKYEQNIEIVDPQLKNNPDLVEVLIDYEKNWERGKTYFLDKPRFHQLLHFSQLMEGLCEKYPDFKEKLECRDADVFVFIPCMLVFKALQGNDKGICEFFLPEMFEEGEKNYEMMNDALNLLSELNHKKTELDFDSYNMLEKLILNIKFLEGEENKYLEKKDLFDSIKHKITILSISLQRCKPSEWNEFMDVAVLGSQQFNTNKQIN